MATTTPHPDPPHQHHDPNHRTFGEYYQAVQGRPPRQTLLLALDKLEAEPTNHQRFAVDLGCGNGRDTVEILRRGWQVLAMDKETDAIARLTQRPDLNATHLQTQVASFESFVFPEQVDLVNASFCLQFCPAEQFSVFWPGLVDALVPGGRFSGQLIGERDSWTQYPNMTCYSLEQVKACFKAFDFDFFEEEEHPGETALGEQKYWHIFQIVASKKR
jgi:tellurite methyltransferase